MISSIDIIISLLYIFAIVFVGIWIGAKKKKTSAADYFLAGKTLRWPMIGMALFATNISCVHLVSLAQSGFDTGLLNGNFEWMAIFVLIIFALFFVPFYLKSRVTTLPEFLEKRYNRACRDWLTIVSVISAIIIHIAFSLLAGGIILKTLFGINMYISVVVLSTLVAIYTIIGGLKAVVITESIQTIVLVIGALILTVASWIKLGGWDPLLEVLRTTQNLDKLSILRPEGDPSGMPWYAIFLGYPVLGIWYWCADQTIVQRVLGAKNENNAQIGALFCGFLKIFPVFIFVLPGLLAYALSHKGLINIEQITSTNSLGESVVNSKGIYTVMITQLLPVGLVGVLVAALLSGLMSQVSSALNSISTLISYDLFKRNWPDISDKKLVRFGRFSAAVSLLFSIAILPLLDRYESLFLGLNDIIGHIAPPITCVFLLGVFWKKASAKSAQLTLWIGSFLGSLLYAINKIFPTTVIGKIPFMLMTFYLFSICVLLQICLSYTYRVKHTTESEKLYWKFPLEPLKNPGWNGLGNYKLLSGILLTILILLYAFFK
jgi:solute:Na+ symporter, SSS family